MVYSILIITANYHKKRSTPCRNLIATALKLARKLHSNTCAKLLEFLKKLITSDAFIKQNRQRPTDFIRQRKLPFSTLIFFLIKLIKGSYQDELNYFFKAILGFDVAPP